MSKSKPDKKSRALKSSKSGKASKEGRAGGAKAAKIKVLPDHHDAQIVLQLYDLRREAVMRQSRLTILKWLPRSWEDVKAIVQLAHPDNAAFRQVSSYFEMAYGMARHGIVNPDFLAENAGEGFMILAKVRPYLEQYRREFAPTAFMNAEWMVAHSRSAEQRLEMFRARVAKLLQSS